MQGVENKRLKESETEIYQDDFHKLFIIFYKIIC